MRPTIACLVALLIPGLAAGDDLSRRIDKGVKCYEELNYGCALKKLSAVVAAIDGGAEVPPARRIEVFETLAFVLASVERGDEARKAFARCFDVDPKFRLDPKVISPKIYRHYKTARRVMLRARLKGTLPKPALPEPYAPAPITASDLLLHVPAEVALAGGLAPEEELRQRLDFLAGGHVLFAEDAALYGAGFWLSLAYKYKLTDIVQVGLLGFFTQHAYAGDDLKSGFSGTLYVVDAGPLVEAVFAIGDWVEVSVGVAGGVGLAGLGNLSDQVGGWVAGIVGVAAVPAKEFAVGVSVLPSVVVATKSDDEVGTSFTLPILVTFEARF